MESLLNWWAFFVFIRKSSSLIEVLLKETHTDQYKHLRILLTPGILCYAIDPSIKCQQIPRHTFPLLQRARNSLHPYRGICLLTKKRKLKGMKMLGFNSEDPGSNISSPRASSQSVKELSHLLRTKLCPSHIQASS